MSAVSRKLLNLVLGVVLLVGLMPATAKAEPVTPPPALSGTFIQPDLVEKWSDDQLESHVRYLKRAGIQELVIQWTADSGKKTTIYPSSLPGFTQSTSTDIVGRILAKAELVGVKVHLGLQVNDEWWRSYANDAAWLNNEAQIARALADDLTAKYGGSPTVDGWYLSFEVDNFNFPKTSWDAMAAFYDSVIGHIRGRHNQLVTIAPFYNTSGGLDPVGWQEMWTHILAKVDIDVIALQDGVGAGHATTAELPAWFSATREAIRAASPTTELWSDTETFNPDFTPMAVSLVAENLKAVEPYVTRYWAFSYDHYDSPLVVSSTYDSTYRAYLATGAVETVAPSVPGKPTLAMAGLQSVSLEWAPAGDDTGVAGYFVLRDGQQVARIDGGPNCSSFDADNAGCQAPSAATSLTDDQVSGGSHSYQVMAFDAAGNRSEPSEAATIRVTETPQAPLLLSGGRGYTCTTPASDSYPDATQKLTDGVVGDALFTDPAWTGRLTTTSFSCTVDLGEQRAISEVVSRWLQDPGVGIVPPNSIDVEVSDDGQSFVAAGSMGRPGGVDGTAVATYRLVGVDVFARHVRLVVHPNTGGWSFTDELEVRAQGPTATRSPNPSVTPSVSPSPSADPSPSAKPVVPPINLVVPYEVPGFHVVNGRHWFTQCDKYSQTQRCRTEIWATKISEVNGKFVSTTGWLFNNLTYLPYMTRAQWTYNPLGKAGSWTAQDGRGWRTVCDSPATGKGACRSYTHSKYIASKKTAAGTWSHYWTQSWVFNSIVRFRDR